MKRKSIALLFAALATTFALADSWKVISVSKPGIKVGGKVIKAGSIVNSDAEFTWLPGNGAQWVKLGRKGGKIKTVSSSVMRQNNISTIDQLIKISSLSSACVVSDLEIASTVGLASRGVDLLNEMDMRDFFAKPIMLEDSLTLHVPYDLDEQHVLFLQYEAQKTATPSSSADAQKTEVINKVLPGSGNTVTIDDRIFMLDGKPTAPVTRTYRLYYYDMVENTTTLIADSLVIDVDKRQR